MMDDSDGIALSLYDLLGVNECGFSLESGKVPRPAGIPEPHARELALYGGGDYELIFTLPPDRYPVAGVPCTVIGAVIAEKAVLVDGKPMEKRGYQHRWS
jgi:thiamine-monophosphate kinase